jgi:uncharacterized membrane protein
MNKTFDQNDVNTNKGLAIGMAILPVLFFLPLVMEDKKNSAFLKHTANQTLLIFILGVASGVICTILAFIPIIGWLIDLLLPIAIFVLYIINIVNAVQANGKSIPFIGNIEIIK